MNIEISLSRWIFFEVKCPANPHVFFPHILRWINHVTAARFMRHDYDRKMALVLTAPAIPGQTGILGVVRIFADSDNERDEYAIIVRRDYTGQGLGAPDIVRVSLAL